MATLLIVSATDPDLISPPPRAQLRPPDLLILPILLGVLLVLARPDARHFFDIDEGYNLVRASLHLHGYQLYKDIWCDQPPLFTTLLSELFAVTGESLVAARVLMAGFSLLLLVSLYALVRSLRTPWEAFLTVLLLAASAYYLRVSVSVMETIPSMAMALLSLALLARARPKPWVALAAGILFALAIQIKLNTLLFAPLSVLLLVHRGRLTAAWLAGWALTTGCVLLVLYRPGAGVVWSVHASARSAPELQHLKGFSVVPAMFGLDRDIGLLALVGLVRSVSKRTRGMFFPLLWLLLFSAAFFFHAPVWYHYYVLIAPPLCWLAAFGAVALCRWTTTPRSTPSSTTTWMNLAVAVMMLLLLTVKGMRAYRHLNDPSFRIEPAIVQGLREDHDDGTWVVAVERQIYPFLAGRAVPPELAVTSAKRRVRGDLTPERFVDLVTSYQPRHVVTPADFTMPIPLQHLLDEHYRLVVEGERTDVYERKGASS